MMQPLSSLSTHVIPVVVRSLIMFTIMEFLMAQKLHANGSQSSGRFL
jgi:hypothetical protein